MSGEERNKLASLAMYLVIGSSIAGNFFSGWMARLFWLSRYDWCDVLCVFSCDGRRVFRGARSSCAAVVVSSDWVLSGRVRSVHDVSAAAVSDVAADDGRGILLQHRARGVGGGRGVLRAVLQSGRSSARIVLCWISFSASGVPLVLDAEGEGLNPNNEQLHEQVFTRSVSPSCRLKVWCATLCG